MDHTDVGLGSVIRALADVVAPAVDPDDSRAREQLRLSIDYIEFVLERLDFRHDRALFELRHHLGMAGALREIIGSLALHECAALEAAIEQGEQALTEQAAPARRMKDVTAALAAAIAVIVRAAPAFDAAVRRRIEQGVVRASAERIAFERSWYLPLGFDPDPGDVRPLQQVMDGPIPDQKQWR